MRYDREGADVNAKSKYAGPLHISVEWTRGHLEILDRCGADVNVPTNSGQTLHFAAENEQPEVAKHLIDNQADVNARNRMKKHLSIWIPGWRNFNKMRPSRQGGDDDEMIKTLLDVGGGTPA